MSILEPADADQKARALIASGSSLFGAGVGAAIGLFGGPFGAVGGAVAGSLAGEVLTRVGREVADRWLGPREAARIGAAIAVAANRIERRLHSGDVLRSDGFFLPTDLRRSAAEEVAESALIKIQRTAEERKVPFIANIIANVCFDEEIDEHLAHILIRTSEALSYRQFCLLSIFQNNDYGLRSENYVESPEDVSESTSIVLTEIFDLFKMNCVCVEETFMLDYYWVKPSAMELTSIGKRLAALLSLDELSALDRDEVSLLLR